LRSVVSQSLKEKHNIKTSELQPSVCHPGSWLNQDTAAPGVNDPCKR
jgi:hypothetical protein